MSPAVVNQFNWYARIFGGRQSARSTHFLVMLSFLAFLIVHVTLMVMTGFARNMNHIVQGPMTGGNRGSAWLSGHRFGCSLWIAAHYVSWHNPRALQHAQKVVTYPLMCSPSTACPGQHMYSRRERYFALLLAKWQNPGARGLEATGRRWIQRLSSAGLRVWSTSPWNCLWPDPGPWQRHYITMHHCIQGWTGIAKWGGLPMGHSSDSSAHNPRRRLSPSSPSASPLRRRLLRHAKP